MDTVNHRRVTTTARKALSPASNILARAISIAPRHGTPNTRDIIRTTHTIDNINTLRISIFETADIVRIEEAAVTDDTCPSYRLKDPNALP